MVPEQNEVGSTGTHDAGGKGHLDFADDLQGIVSPLKDSVTKAVDENREQGADKLKLFADAINAAAPSLDKEMPKIASYVRDAGTWVEQSAEHIRQQKFDVLLESASTFARNNPAAAFGLAALTGFALSRFLKSERTPIAGVSTSSGNH